ncbi:hypothetical protein GQ43DRAFT_368768 [Delitschia confertaspora ATCC 74209]|uniref:Zn(2)-C6 fungal-type domain-containing protein n=1 Tax=Delitschia confertaspora ATCC 74209 TaxID=1513339 RepID=A0A9P4MR61_9PLEO|nr:hypothetical protein GQ43DRAFT_368768 [Delitschia confertaspora ATCC 74209]
MSRLPSISSIPSIPQRPVPQQPFASYQASYHRPTFAASSRPDIVPPAHHHHQVRESEGSHNNATTQLPSLRTLLEPQLLDPKVSEASPRLGGGVSSLSNSSRRYGSSSPTLKRRHDFDGYSHGRIEHSSNALVSSRTTPVHPPASNSAAAEPHSFSTPNSTPGSRPSEYARHCRSSHGEAVSNAFRPSSTVQAETSVSSDTAGHYSSHMTHEESIEMGKASVRRRTEMSSRMPARASRCIGQRDIPGEGLCYVYEDGTYCRAVIDGEPVNPSWGITKAGKPRKRLAQACLTCREKKIKCEPGYPKCHQCAKSARACRGGLSLSQAGTTDESTPRPSSSSSSLLFKKAQSTEVSSASRTHEEHHEFPWNAGAGPLKLSTFRRKTLSENRGMSVHSLDTDWSGSLNDPDHPDATRRGSYQDQLAVQWEQDPYEADARLTMHLLDLYFWHAGRATYGIFPRQPFLAWVEGPREKSQDDRMLLYSVLAMGSIFSTDAEHQAIGKQFAAIAAYAIEKRFGKFTLQLCQSRLILGLYNFAKGMATQAWDFCGAGLRAISALKLNTEEGIKDFPEDAELDYGFDRWTLEECCRRTFWSGFLMDVSSTAFTAATTSDITNQQRYNGFCGSTLCVISPEDTFLRLPCLEDAYEASTPCETPLFDFELLTRNAFSGSSSMGIMAYLTLISTIWGEVLTFTSRATHRSDQGYERYYESFYAKTYEQLDAWLGMLPPYLQYSQHNLDTSVVEGYVGTFLSLHALYHTTIIRLNRHVRARVLLAPNLRRNIDRAFRSASHFLSIMHSISPSSHQHLSPAGTDAVLSVPFPGYALMLSVDVLTACGTIATLPELISSLSTTISCLEELSTFWASAGAQRKAISGRMKQLQNIAWKEEQGVQNGNLGAFWRLGESLEAAFGGEDAVYRAEDRVLFEMVGEFTKG